MGNPLVKGTKLVGKSLLQFGKILGEETKEIAKSTGAQVTGEFPMQKPSEAPDLYNLPDTHAGPVNESEIQKLDLRRAQELEAEMAEIRRQKVQIEEQKRQSEIARLRQIEASQPQEVPQMPSRPARGKGPGVRGKIKSALSSVVGRAEKGRNVSQ